MALYNSQNISGSDGVIDGSTVTPTDNISIWLKCAELTETYTTLNEVLADDDVMEKLFRSENASDYLVRSTTWANDITANQTAMILIGANDYCADKLLDDSTWRTAICNSTYFENVLNVKIPAMTSDSQDGFVASASSSFSASEHPYMAFKNDLTSTDGWGAQNGTQNNSWLQIEFPFSVKVNKIAINMDARAMSTNPYFRDFIFDLKGSDDGTTFTNIATNLEVEWISNVSYSLSQALNNSVKYKYYRIVPVQYNCTYSNGYMSLINVNLYGRATKTTIYSAANDIVSFVDDEGAKVVTTDATGKGEVTIVCKPNTDITFTSSIAKNPDNLSENYSKVVTIKSSAEPVYVMPNKDTLYWWGYKSNNLEVMSTANGWGGSSGSYIAPTYDINKIIMATPSSGYLSGVAIKNALTGTNKIYAIAKGVTKVNNDYGALKGEASKALSYDGIEQATFNYDTILKVELNASRSYVCAYSVSGRTSELYAFWYNSDDDDSKAEISAIGTNEDKPTASRAYAVGEHFYKDGKFCTVKAAIAIGATFNLGTNYVEGTVAEQTKAVNDFIITPVTGVTIDYNDSLSSSYVNKLILGIGISSALWSGLANEGDIIKVATLTNHKPTNVAVFGYTFHGSNILTVFIETNGDIKIRLMKKGSSTLQGGFQFSIIY